MIPLLSSRSLFSLLRFVQGHHGPHAALSRRIVSLLSVLLRTFPSLDRAISITARVILLRFYMGLCQFKLCKALAEN